MSCTLAKRGWKFGAVKVEVYTIEYNRIFIRSNTFVINVHDTNKNAKHVMLWKANYIKMIWWIWCGGDEY
jgi:hypothetical protein